MEMEILEGARKDLMAPTSLKKAPSPISRVEEPTSTPAPNPLPAYEPEGPVSPEELALVPRRWPLPPLVFPLLGRDDSEIPPLEDTDGPVARPIGSMLGLTALASLKMTVLHMPVMGEVHYHLQAQSTTRMSWQLHPCRNNWSPL